MDEKNGSRNGTNSDNEFKIYFTEIKNRLKKIYINNFETTGVKKDGIDFCKEISIYLAPLTENIRDAERIIHTSICHHPVQWVREFISYHLTSRDSLGKTRYPLEMLSMKMGIDYTKSHDNSVPTFRKK